MSEEIIDLKIFKDKKEECHGVGDCDHLLRIIAALKYYELNGKDEFIEFCVKNYSSQSLEDYIHFICAHRNDLNEIANHNDFKCDNINHCQRTLRHFRERNDDKESAEYDLFYVQYFDTIHFCLYHLEQFGLRVSINNNNNNNDDDMDNKQDDGDYLNCVDKQIGKIQKEIKSKIAKCNIYSNRLDNTKNNKFNIMVNNKNKNKLNENSKNNKENKGKQNIWNKAKNAMSKYFKKGMFYLYNIYLSIFCIKKTIKTLKMKMRIKTKRKRIHLLIICLFIFVIKTKLNMMKKH